jgi:BioD-like phosphotransacetylase family protein
MLRQSTLPVIVSPSDSHTIARRIHSLTIKIEPGDAAKIRNIQDLVATNVNIERLLEKTGY